MIGPMPMLNVGFLNRWRRLDRVRRALLFRAAWWLSVASASVALLPFKRAIRLGCVDRRDSKGVAPGDLVGAIETASRHLPWRTMCIERGIAAQRMLRAQGFDAVLHYGVSCPALSGDLQAHVWVTVGGRAVIGGEQAADFAEVAAYP